MKKIAAVVVASGALLIPGSALADTSTNCDPSSATCTAYSNNVGAVKDTGASRSNTPSKTSSPSSSTAPAASTTPSVSNVDSENATRSASPSTASELPFTGIDIVPLVAGGAALLGAGLFVRRMSSDDK